MDGDAPKKPYVLISHDHYAKLTTLHARYGAGGDPDERIFCVVTRYEAFQGARRVPSFERTPCRDSSCRRRVPGACSKVYVSSWEIR